MRNYSTVEYTKRSDGKYNRWQKLSRIQLGQLSQEEWDSKDRPEYLNPYVWTITGTFSKIPRNKRV